MAEREQFAVKLGNATFYGEETGAGQTIVCLHAGVGDRRMFNPQMDGLGDRFHLVSYDRREFGDTTSPDEPFRHMDDLAALLDERAITRPVLFGCSQGGRVAIDFTLAHPTVPAGLVLIGTALSGAAAPDVDPAAQALHDRLDAAEESEDMAAVNEIEAQMWLDGPLQPAGRVGGAERELFLDMNLCALTHTPLYAEQDPPSATDKIETLNLPVLLIRGEFDFDHIAVQHQMLADRLPDAQSHVIDGVAHLPSLENPGEVNELVQAFVASLPG